MIAAGARKATWLRFCSPTTGCFFISTHSSGVRRAGLSRMVSLIAILPMSCSSAPCSNWFRVQSNVRGFIEGLVRHLDLASIACSLALPGTRGPLLNMEVDNREAEYRLGRGFVDRKRV